MIIFSSLLSITLANHHGDAELKEISRFNFNPANPEQNYEIRDGASFEKDGVRLHPSSPLSHGAAISKSSIHADDLHIDFVVQIENARLSPNVQIKSEINPDVAGIGLYITEQLLDLSNAHTGFTSSPYSGIGVVLHPAQGGIAVIILENRVSQTNHVLSAIWLKKTIVGPTVNIPVSIVFHKGECTVSVMGVKTGSATLAEEVKGRIIVGAHSGSRSGAHMQSYEAMLKSLVVSSSDIDLHFTLDDIPDSPKHALLLAISDFARYVPMIREESETQLRQLVSKVHEILQLIGSLEVATKEYLHADQILTEVWKLQTELAKKIDNVTTQSIKSKEASQAFSNIKRDVETIRLKDIGLISKSKSSHAMSRTRSQIMMIITTLAYILVILPIIILAYSITRKINIWKKSHVL